MINTGGAQYRVVWIKQFQKKVYTGIFTYLHIIIILFYVIIKWLGFMGLINTTLASAHVIAWIWKESEILWEQNFWTMTVIIYMLYNKEGGFKKGLVKSE